MKALFLCLCLTLAILPAHASDFYRGKQIELMVPTNPGGSTDVEARLMGDFLKRHIPGNPDIHVVSRAGAGGLILLNHMLQNAIPNGLTVGYAAGLYESYLISTKGLLGDPETLVKIAHFSSRQSCYTNTKTLSDPAKFLEVPHIWSAGMNPRISPDIRVRLALDILGVNYTHVPGFRSLADARVAVLQNTVQFACEADAAFTSGIRSDPETYLPLFTFLEGDDGLPDFADYHRQLRGRAPSGDKWEALQDVSDLGLLSRALVLPEGSPPEAVAALKLGVARMVEDAQFQAMAKTLTGRAMIPVPESSVRDISMRLRGAEKTRRTLGQYFKGQ